MRLEIFLGFLLSFNLTLGQQQQITRIDGGKISIPTIDSTILHLMSAAKITGLGLYDIRQMRAL